MKKRNLFTEMKKGFDALANARNGKQTLRSHEVDLKPACGEISLYGRPVSNGVVREFRYISSINKRVAKN